MHIKCFPLSLFSPLLLLLQLNVLSVGVQAFHGGSSWLPQLRQSLFSPKSAPRPQKQLVGVRCLSAGATGTGTVLIAAENKLHNGFMHAECPDRVGVMWKAFGESGILDKCK